MHFLVIPLVETTGACSTSLQIMPTTSGIGCAFKLLARTARCLGFAKLNAENVNISSTHCAAKKRDNAALQI